MAWVKVDQEVVKKYMRDQGKWTVYSEEVVDLSSKTLDYDTDVAEGQRMRVEAVRIEFAATATVGTRMLEIRVLDSGSDVVQALELSASITASASKNYQVAVGLPANVGSSINYETLPPNCIVLPGQSLQVLDAAAIDAAADDMTVHVAVRIF